jgi:hypothetical protein
MLKNFFNDIVTQAATMLKQVDLNVYDFLW